MNTPETAVALAEIRKDIVKMQDDMEDLQRSIRALVEAWNTATNVVKFVKFLSTFMAAIAGLWLFLRHGFRAGG